MRGLVFKTMHCGYVVVSEYHNREKVEVIFVATGHKITTKKDILLGSPTPRLRDPLARSVFGVGCIGVGPHLAHHNQADTHAFSIWRAMLRRCYYRGAKHHQASYEGISVDPRWHNFQTFAQWFEENYPRDGGRYQLDKDFKLPGNKVYSPEACAFLPQADNLRARWAGRRSGEQKGTGRPAG